MAYGRKPERIPRDVAALVQLEEKEEFMEMARRISSLIKEIGSLPTPRQLKVYLDIDARKMRTVCGSVRTDPYDMLVREAKKILLKEEEMIVGFGRVQRASKEQMETQDTPK